MGVKRKIKKIAQVMVPIGTAALAATPAAPVAPLVPFIVRGLEATFGAKTGETKKKIAVNMAMQVAEQLQAAGILPEALTETQLSELIEEEVADMKEAGYEPIQTAQGKDLAIDIAMAALTLASQIQDGEV
jgi:hypothetical protein